MNLCIKIKFISIHNQSPLNRLIECSFQRYKKTSVNKSFFDKTKSFAKKNSPHNSPKSYGFPCIYNEISLSTLAKICKKTLPDNVRQHKLIF